MLTAVVTEIPRELEAVTDDAFDEVTQADRRAEPTAARIARLFGTEPRRAIVD